MKKLLFCTGIAAMAIGGLLLVFNLIILVQGHTEFIDADNIVLDNSANRAHLVSEIRNVGFWQWLFMTLGEVTLFTAGLLGLLFREKPQRRLLSVILSGAALVFWILMCIFYAKLIPLLEAQNVFGDGTSTAVLIVSSILFAIPAAVYTVCMLREKKAATITTK